MIQLALIDTMMYPGLKLVSNQLFLEGSVSVQLDKRWMEDHIAWTKPSVVRSNLPGGVIRLNIRVSPL